MQKDNEQFLKHKSQCQESNQEKQEVKQQKAEDIQNYCLINTPQFKVQNQRHFQRFSDKKIKKVKVQNNEINEEKLYLINKQGEGKEFQVFQDNQLMFKTGDMRSLIKPILEDVDEDSDSDNVKATVECIKNNLLQELEAQKAINKFFL